MMEQMIRKGFKGMLTGFWEKEKSRVCGAKIILGMCMVLFAIGAINVSAKAAEEIQVLSQIMTAKEATAMKAEPKEEAETLMVYEKDDAVFVTGETTNGWYQVSYQDKEGYVPTGALAIQEMDIEALNAEMAVEEAETALVLETVEQYRKEAVRSKIWGGIIVLLVVGIFAIGIISMRRENSK